MFVTFDPLALHFLCAVEKGLSDIVRLQQIFVLLLQSNFLDVLDQLQNCSCIAALKLKVLEHSFEDRASIE